MDTVVAGIIENDAGQVLVLRAEDGSWEFPCGPARPEESFEAAMRRIAREQLGLQIEIHVGQPPLTGHYRGQPAVFRFFLAGVMEAEPKARTGDDALWLGVDELRRTNASPLTRQVVEWYAGN